MRKVLVFVAMVVLVLGIANAKDSDTGEFYVGANPGLDLSNVSGNVVLRQGDGDRIVVSYTKKDDDVEVEMSQNGDEVTVRVKYPERRWNKKTRGVEFEVWFPAEGDLDISTVSGNIEMEAISGDINLKTVSGNIELTDSAGDINTEVVSGNIYLTRIGEADLNANAVSGKVTYAQGDLIGDTNLSTVSGSILVEYNPGAAFTVSGNVMSGRVSAGNSGLRVKKAKYGPQTSVDGDVNGGGDELNLNSVSGNINLREN